MQDNNIIETTLVTYFTGSYTQNVKITILNDILDGLVTTLLATIQKKWIDVGRYTGLVAYLYDTVGYGR